MRDLPTDLSPQEVKQKLDAGEPVYLVDVREPHEHATARIDGAELIPLRTLPHALESLRTKPGTLVVFCHHGIRSRNAVSYLRKQGLRHSQSMAGGIEAWSTAIDPSVPRY